MLFYTGIHSYLIKGIVSSLKRTRTVIQVTFICCIHMLFSEGLIKYKPHPAHLKSFLHRVLLWSTGPRWSRLWEQRPWSEPRPSPSRRTSSPPWRSRCSREPPRPSTAVSSGRGGGHHGGDVVYSAAHCVVSSCRHPHPASTSRTDWGGDTISLAAGLRPPLVWDCRSEARVTYRSDSYTHKYNII